MRFLFRSIGVSLNYMANSKVKNQNKTELFPRVKEKEKKTPVILLNKIIPAIVILHIP